MQSIQNQRKVWVHVSQPLNLLNNFLLQSFWYLYSTFSPNLSHIQLSLLHCILDGLVTFTEGIGLLKCSGRGIQESQDGTAFDAKNISQSSKMSIFMWSWWVCRHQDSNFTVYLMNLACPSILLKCLAFVLVSLVAPGALQFNICRWKIMISMFVHFRHNTEFVTKMLITQFPVCWEATK